jgi:hypothetical protein
VSNHPLADSQLTGLLFHAACLAWQGKALLLAGESGAGKSSLAFWLASQGFQYLTDELVLIPEGKLECLAFTRPLHLRKTAEALFPDLLERGAQTDRSVPDEIRGWLVNPGQPDPDVDVMAAALHCIVLPHFLIQHTFTLQRLSNAQAVVALAPCLIRARNLPENGFPELVRLARSVPVSQLTYSSFDQIGGRLHDLMQSGFTEPPARLGDK